MTTTTITRTACKYPGCGQLAAPAAGTGRPPEYCAGRGHTRVSAWRERRRLAAEQAGTTISAAEDGSPLTTARMTGAELLRSLRAEADRITALGAGLRDRIDTLTDPTAAEAEVEAVRAAAEQRAAAAEEMSEHLTAAQALAQASPEPTRTSHPRRHGGHRHHGHADPPANQHRGRRLPALHAHESVMTSQPHERLHATAESQPCERH